MSDKSQQIKINNRKAAHSQAPHSLKQKRHGSGKGGWGDPMDDLKFMDQDPSKNPDDPNYEPESQNVEAEQVQQPQNQAQVPNETSETRLNESEYFQNFQSDVESLSAFKIKVEELVHAYLFNGDEDKFIQSLNVLNCANFYNQVPKVLLWTVIAAKKQEHFPPTRKLLMHLRSTETINRAQLESAFRRLFHRLNELSTLNSNAYIILVDFGEYCVARNLMEAEFLTQLKKQTEFAKDPQRIERLKKHISEIVAEYFSSGDVDEAIRCVSEMDTPFYNHEVVKRIISKSFDYANRERELTSQFLAKAVGDNLYNETANSGKYYAIPRKNCELGFIILLQRVEGLYKDVPDVLELLSLFIGRAIVDEVLPPNFIENQHYLLQTDMGYTVINHVKHLLSGTNHVRHNDQLLNCWGTSSTKDISSMKKAIGGIIKEYLISRELDEALTAIQELNVPMFHHEIIKQLIPAVADYYIAKDLIVDGDGDDDNEKVSKLLNIPMEIQDKAVQIQLAIDLISTALEHNIMAVEQVSGGFKRLRLRMDDYKLDCPLITKYYDCIAQQFRRIVEPDCEERKEEMMVRNANTFVGGAKEKEIDDGIKEIIGESKKLVVEYMKKNGINGGVDVGDKYEIIQCKTQMVAGVVYFLKICIAEDKYIHVFVWKKLDESLEILNVEINKIKADALVFNNKNNKADVCVVPIATAPVKRALCGGLRERDIDEVVIESCKRIKEDVIVKASEHKQEDKFTEFTPISCKSQVVAGTNLFVKVKVNENSFIHIRIWCKLDSSIELTNVEWNKNENDEIIYF